MSLPNGSYFKNLVKCTKNSKIPKDFTLLIIFPIDPVVVELFTIL